MTFYDKSVPLHHTTVFFFLTTKIYRSVIKCKWITLDSFTLTNSFSFLAVFVLHALWEIHHNCDIDLSAFLSVLYVSQLWTFFYDTHSSPHRFQPQVNTPHLHSRCGRRSSGLSVGPILIISISHTLSSAAPPPPVSSLFWSRRSSGGLSEFDSLHKQWVWLLSTTGKDSTIDKGLKHIQACWADSGLVQKL